MQLPTKMGAPSFNLWLEPWIQMETADGQFLRMNIQEALLEAHTLRTIYEPSPLFIVGIHRLLTAILQDAIKPESNADLEALWKEGRFSKDKVDDFSKKYLHKFDIFSESDPFFQSGDLPLTPEKRSEAKTSAYLIPETPSGTNIVHFAHGEQSDHVLCPSCAASGLIAVPAFATSGGAGIKPSINGVPPIYIIPLGSNLFESLVLSLVSSDYQPRVANPLDQDAWWRKPSIVQKCSEISRVGYLHSLTFQARRIRLHPEIVNTQCSRCGSFCSIGVKTMVFEMGESRPKESPPWFDPFAAYRIRGGKVIPIRPSSRHATWREFGSLFLKTPEQDGAKEITIRPSVIDQMADLFLRDDAHQSTCSFRCIGMRTDMKAKIFEWIDTGFQVPDRLLVSVKGGLEVENALRLSSDIGNAINKAFRISFDRSSKSERYNRIRAGMLDRYWQKLALPFRHFTLSLDPEAPAAAQKTWQSDVVGTAKSEFHNAANSVGDDALRLRQRVEGERLCNILISKLLEKGRTFNE